MNGIVLDVYYSYTVSGLKWETCFSIKHFSRHYLLKHQIFFCLWKGGFTSRFTNSSLMPLFGSTFSDASTCLVLWSSWWPTTPAHADHVNVCSPVNWRNFAIWAPGPVMWQFSVAKRPNGWNAEARFFTVATKPWENKAFLYYYLFERLEPETEEHQGGTFLFTREAFLALGLSCVALKKMRRFLNVVHPVLLATQTTI